MLQVAYCVLASALAITSVHDANTIRRALEARYHRAVTLKAVFYESYRDAGGGGEAESGIVYFSRPGRMRWEYESPQEKLFLVDGTNVWFYIPADHAASRAKMKESSDWRTPLALLAGKADLGKLCRNLEVVASLQSPSQPDKSASHGDDADEKPLAPDDSVLRCIPRGAADQPTGVSDEPIRDVLLETDAAGYLVRVIIRQPGHLETEFRFGSWQENIAIPESKFHFSPPPGIEIVDEDKLAGELH